MRGGNVDEPHVVEAGALGAGDDVVVVGGRPAGDLRAAREADVDRSEGGRSTHEGPRTTRTALDRLADDALTVVSASSDRHRLLHDARV